MPFGFRFIFKTENRENERNRKKGKSQTIFCWNWLTRMIDTWNKCTSVVHIRDCYRTTADYVSASTNENDKPFEVFFFDSNVHFRCGNVRLFYTSTFKWFYVYSFSFSIHSTFIVFHWRIEATSLPSQLLIFSLLTFSCRLCRQSNGVEFFFLRRHACQILWRPNTYNELFTVSLDDKKKKIKS